MLELINRDAAGRICKFTVNKKTIETPNICIVINPNIQLISPQEMKSKFNTNIIITNSYIIDKSKYKKNVLDDGLHKFLKFDGIIYTDSGVYQMYSQRIKDINQDQILEFQQKIGSDIITPVDLFTLPEDSRKIAQIKLKETMKRISSARKKIDKYLVAPIQGGMYLDLRKNACKQASKLNPDLFAIGGIVPLMEQYRFKELCDIIITCKKNLPSNKIIHAFGAGHPMIFSLLIAIGVDLFDSAMYALAAKRNGYLTEHGTYNLNDLSYFPCSCPICSTYTPEQVRQMPQVEKEKILAMHNLYVTYSEINTIKQAIKNNSLWELVQQRVRAHPSLLEALKHILKKDKNYFLKKDLFTKKTAFFELGEESKYRPEVIRAKKMLKNVKSKNHVLLKPFGKIPPELLLVYPFGQSVLLSKKPLDIKIDSKKAVKMIIKYQYNSKINTDFNVEVSKKTGRIRRIWKNKKLLGTIRANDGLFLPTIEGAKYINMKKIIVNKEALEYVKEGKSLFAKFVDKCDDFVPGEEIAITDGKKIIALGKAMLNSDEIKEFEKGVAIKTRKV